MEDIDALKRSLPGQRAPKYRLRNANVYVSDGGLHFIDYLDPVEEIPEQIDASRLTERDRNYIETSLQSNVERFAHQVRTLEAYLAPAASRILDIGCGGGLFLSMLAERGGNVVGIELSDSRAEYARSRHRLEVHKRPIEADYWQQGRGGCFDAVTLWDVIEHVNFPRQTLHCAAAVIRPGGYLFIDTPCRDSFYHRFGECSHRLTRGRLPTFLNAMYSSHRFGHKQIFSTGELAALLDDAGFEVVQLEKFHELSLPYHAYLHRLLRSELLARLAAPMAALFFRLFKVRNKMLIVGRKR